MLRLWRFRGVMGFRRFRHVATWCEVEGTREGAGSGWVQGWIRDWCATQGIPRVGTQIGLYTETPTQTNKREELMGLLKRLEKAHEVGSTKLATGVEISPFRGEQLVQVGRYCGV